MTSPRALGGMAFSIASILFSNVGILFQKRSADLERGKPLCKRWRFWLGFTLNVGSEAGLTTMALILAPLSFIAPLGGLAVVFNALMAHFGCVLAKERMRRSEWFATLLIVGGVVLVAISGPSGEEGETATMEALPANLAQPGFIVYTGLAAASVVLWLFFWKQKCFRCLYRCQPSEDSIVAAVGSSLTAALTGAFSTIFLKVVAIAIGELAEHGTPPTSPLLWGCVACLCVSAPLQLYLLNMTLASGRATFTIPLYLSLMMLLTSASGGLLFNEFDAVASREPRPLWMITYILAVCVVIVGLAYLSQQQQHKTFKRMASSRDNSIHGSPSAAGCISCSRIFPAAEASLASMHLSDLSPKALQRKQQQQEWSRARVHPGGGGAEDNEVDEAGPAQEPPTTPCGSEPSQSSLEQGPPPYSPRAVSPCLPASAGAAVAAPALVLPRCAVQTSSIITWTSGGCGHS